MTAVVCVLAPFSIPIGPVPISFATFAIYVTVIVLGRKRATLVCLMYLLIGFVGLPVFSGFTGGPTRLLGPTGGYFGGYLLLTIIAGWFVDKFSEKKWMCLLGLILGTMVCYAVGTVWLAFQMEIDFPVAFMLGVVPFIFGDAIKIVVAVWVGSVIRSRLKRSGFLENKS